MTTRPHDALFRSAFENPAAAAALLRELLPAEIRELITWDTLDRDAASFVDPALADYHSDLVFSAPLQIGDASQIFALLEHQSTSDPAMPLRTLSYQTRIWSRFRKDHPTASLPPIVVVLVSHARGGWTTSRAFDDLFAPTVLAIPSLAALVPRTPLIIEDLADRSNEDLKAWSLAAFPKLALWLLRDARDPARLLDSFDMWIDTFAAAERAPGGSDAIAALLTYLFWVVDPMHHDELRAKIRQLDSHIEENAMTIAEHLIEQGRMEGLEQGREQGLEQGREQGLEQGREQGLEQGRIDTLRHQVTIKFGSGSLDARYEALLRSPSPEAVDRYLQRVLFADSLAAVFDD
jgi:hypothetical protein